MSNNNFFESILNGKSEISNGRLRALYEKFKNNPTIPLAYRKDYQTPERVVSDYLDWWLYPPDVEYAKHLPTVEYNTKNGKHVKVEYMGLADYEIYYRATRITVEDQERVLNQTVVGNNTLIELELAEILEYTRLMYSEEEFNHLMEHVAKCAEKIPYAIALPEYDSIHRRNGRKFRQAFKKDAFARKVIKEVRELNKEKRVYDKDRKAVDALNDRKREEINERVIVKPVLVANNVITTDRFTQKERDE